MKMSHKLLAVVTAIIEWSRGIYGELHMLRGKKHEDLGMDFDYSIPGKVVFSMEKYTRNATTEFPEDLGKTTKTPTAEYLFTVCEDDTRRPLPTEQA